MHADGALVVALQPVHAEIALASLGVLRVGEAEVHERTAVVRPGRDRGNAVQIDLGALVDHVLAGRVLHLLRRHVLELTELAERVLQPAPADRELCLHQVADAVADLIQTVRAQGECHPAIGAEQVDRERHLAAGGLLEQQPWTSGPHDPLDDLGDLEVRVDRSLDPLQLTGTVELGDEVTEVGIRHEPSIGVDRPGQHSGPGREDRGRCGGARTNCGGAQTGRD
jgi:hypothetical protein